VSADSGGTISIEPIYNAGGGNEDKPGEVIVAGQVIAGDVELALVPVRAWSDVGVTSLQALGAPLLIDSDALITAVAASPLVEPLLDAMLEQGLVGLSVWPDGLRHPFAWEQNGPPILAAADLKGAKMWALPSKLQTTILQGLGATPVNAAPVEVDSMVADGSLRAAESSFGGIVSLSGTPTGTADVVLYPKYQVLVAEDSAFSRLTQEQQAIVRNAALAARDLAVTDHVPDSEGARSWCLNGGRVVLAGNANVATFRQAAEPIVAKLSEDPVTATALDAIRKLKATMPPAPPAVACGPIQNFDAPWPSVAPGPPLTLVPDGRYVHTVSREELIAAGATGIDVGNAGRWTLTVSGDVGRLDLRHDDSNPDETFPLRFRLMGDRVRFQLANDEFFDMRWQLEGDVLEMEVVASNSLVSGQSGTARAQSVLDAIFGGAWTKVE